MSYNYICLSSFRIIAPHNFCSQNVVVASNIDEICSGKGAWGGGNCDAKKGTKCQDSIANRAKSKWTNTLKGSKTVNEKVLSGHNSK